MSPIHPASRLAPVPPHITVTLCGETCPLHWRAVSNKLSLQWQRSSDLLASPSLDYPKTDRSSHFSSLYLCIYPYWQNVHRKAGNTVAKEVAQKTGIFCHALSRAMRGREELGPEARATLRNHWFPSPEHRLKSSTNAKWMEAAHAQEALAGTRTTKRACVLTAAPLTASLTRKRSRCAHACSQRRHLQHPWPGSDHAAIQNEINK